MIPAIPAPPPPVPIYLRKNDGCETVYPAGRETAGGLSDRSTDLQND